MQVKYPFRFTKDGFHQFRNDYKKSSIQGTHVTFEDGRTHALTVAHVPQVLETFEKENDNLTTINETETKETKPFTFVELFAGIGGVSFGLERLGGECLLAAEFDPERRGKRQFAQEAYKILHPETPVTGDVYELKSEDVPKCDVLSFTTPCQSFSVAGKRGGFEDVRGTVFFEAMRIANDVKPKIILMENVKGIIGHDKGKTLDTIIKSANDVGYRVDFEVLNSKYFGVPQNRERFFMVGIREDLVPNEPWSEDSLKGTTVVPKGKRRISGYDDVKTFNFDWPEQGEVTTRLRDILEPVVDEKYYLSDDKTAKLVAHLEANPTSENIPLEGVGRLAGLRNRADRVFAYQGDKKRSTAQENIYLRDEAIADSVTVGHMPKYIDAEPKMLGHVDIKGHDAIKRVYSADHIGPTLTTMGGGHREPKTAVQERQRYRIRKLSPLECWRLQGFPDEAHEAVKAAGISDSQRYKQAGNAVTVNVIEAIGERLLPYLS